MQSRKIVLIGKTGDGKSSAGNTILSKQVFITEASANSVTAKCESRHGLVHGRKITVIDTPGFFDTDRKDEEIKSEIIKSLVECAPGVHAFLLVLRVGRYTRQEKEVVQQFLNTMKGEHVLKHTVILFTHGDQLDRHTIKKFVKTNPQLQELVDKCGGRCHVIDNEYWKDCDSGYKSNRVQVKNLLDTIDKMEKENGCLSNELLKKLEEDIQVEIKNNEDNLPPEEKREKAKEIVHKNLCMQFAGATTGMLIGALLGVGVAVTAVLALLKAFCPALKAGAAAVKAAAVKAAAVKAAAGAEAAARAAEAVAEGAAAIEEMAAAGEAVVEAVAAGGKAAVMVVAAAGGAAAAAAAAGGGAAAAAGGGGAAVEAVAVGAAAGGGAAAAGGGAAAVEAVAVGAAAAGGAAAVEAVAVGGGAAAAGAAAVETGAAAGAVVGVKAFAAGVFGAAALAGAVGGGVTGWKAAEEADSVYDAMTKAAKLNYENATVVGEKIQEFVKSIGK